MLIDITFRRGINMSDLIYQHGDLSLIRTDCVPSSFVPGEQEAEILLYTDINQNAYTLECDNGTKYFSPKSKFVELKTVAYLKHQKLGEIRIESGLYKIRMRSEYLHAEHGRRVADYALLLGRALELDEQHLEELKFASRVHDVGFVGCEEVLWKPIWFSDDDWAQVQQHPVRSAKVVDALKRRNGAATDRSHQYVLYHHEHIDGSGYPYGIGDDEIPVGAKILLIADAFEAMTSWRPFREPLPEYAALDRLWGDAGHRFDQKLLELFAAAVDELAICELQF